jgi:chromosomal replication initiator protein
VAPEALRAIASRAVSNLRLLEGALTRILALGSLTSSAITPETVARALPGAGGPPSAAKPEITQVQEAVASRLDVPLERLLSPTRVAPIARARQLAMYLSRELTDLSLPEIASAFNRRDHTTVMHAIRKVEGRVLEDAALARTIEQLTSDLIAPGIDRDRTD